MKRFNLITVVVILALTSALFGCTSSSDSAVLARVNRSKITAADFKRQLEDLAPQMQQAVASDPKAREEFIDYLIGVELALQEAHRQGLDKDVEFKKQQQLRREEMERRIAEGAKRDLLNSLFKKELASKLNAIPQPTEKEIRDYYAKNRDKITAAMGRQVSFSEIAPRLKQVVLNERQQNIYLEYTKELRAKGKVTVDNKALDAVASSLSPSSLPEGLEPETPAAKPDNKKP